MDTLATHNFVNRRKDQPFKDKSMTTAAYKTDRSMNVTVDPNHDTRKDAEAALPKHPIKIPGRFNVTVSVPTDGFLPGRTYNVDKVTKEALEKAKVVLAATDA